METESSTLLLAQACCNSINIFYEPLFTFLLYKDLFSLLVLPIALYLSYTILCHKITF